MEMVSQHQSNLLPVFQISSFNLFFLKYRYELKFLDGPEVGERRPEAQRLKKTTVYRALYSLASWRWSRTPDAPGQGPRDGPPESEFCAIDSRSQG
jgi:hypothetical protein